MTAQLDIGLHTFGDVSANVDGTQRCIELYGTEVIPLVRVIVNHASDLTGSTSTSTV